MQAAGTVAGTAQAAREKTVESYEAGKQKAAETYDATAQKASEAAQATKETAAQAYDTTAQKASEAAQATKEASARALDTTAQKAGEVAGAAKETAAQVGKVQRSAAWLLRVLCSSTDPQCLGLCRSGTGSSSAGYEVCGDKNIPQGLHSVVHSQHSQPAAGCLNCKGWF